MNAPPGGIGGRRGIHGGNVAGSAGSETEQAVVEALADNFDDLYLRGLGVKWIEQVVPGVWGNYGGNARDCRFQGSQPGIANAPCQFQVLFPFAPGSRIERLNRKVIGYRDLQECVEIRGVLRVYIEMYERFNKSRHRGLGQVDNSRTGGVPPRSGLAATFTAEVKVIADTPERCHLEPLIQTVSRYSSSVNSNILKPLYLSLQIANGTRAVVYGARVHSDSLQAKELGNLAAAWSDQRELLIVAALNS